MNGLVIVLTVLTTVVLTFWFIDKFQVNDRFINMLGAVFGMISLLSFVKDKERVMKASLVAMALLLFAFAIMLTLLERDEQEYRKPYDGEAIVSQRFHSTHRGVDFVLSDGTPLFPIYEGVVIRALPCLNCDKVQETITPCTSSEYTNPDWNHGYGRLVVVRHESPFQEYKYLYSLYAHLDTINVSAGDKVSSSTVLGHSGNSGCSTGSHLHFELRGGSVLNTRGVWLQQTAIDPELLI